MNETELKIKNATIELLLVDGNFNISTSDIAKKSKVSRTVIHYYFRSKDNLLSIVENDIINDIIIPKYRELFTENTLRGKIERFVEESAKISEKFPFLDLYSMSQYHHNKSFQKYFNSIQKSFSDLLCEIQSAINDNQISYTAPKCFLIDLFSLTNYSIYLNFFSSDTNHLCSGSNTEVLKNGKQNITDILFKKKY